MNATTEQRERLTISDAVLDIPDSEEEFLQYSILPGEQRGREYEHCSYRQTSTSRNLELDQVSETSNEDPAKNPERKTGSNQCNEQRWLTLTGTHNGKIRRVLIRCDKWRGRECDFCFGIRKERFQTRIKTAITSGSIYWLPIDDKRVADIKSKIGRKNYLQLPAHIPCGGYFFYNATGLEKIGSHILSTLSIPEVIWDFLTDTPKGKYPSGQLGNLEPTEAENRDDDDYDKVECKGIITPKDADNTDRRAQAARAAEEKTAYLDPHTPEEVEEAIDSRMKAFIKELKRRNVPILGQVSMKRWVHIPSIDWHPLRKIK